MGWRAVDSTSKPAWIGWVVQLREVLGIPIPQAGHVSIHGTRIACLQSALAMADTRTLRSAPEARRQASEMLGCCLVQQAR